MESMLLMTHSWLRWLLVILTAAVVVVALVKKLTRTPWSGAGDGLSVSALISADIQLLLGIVLYALVRPPVMMSDPILRYWSVEHGFGMLIAIVLLHVGRARLRRATSSDARVKAALVFYGLGLVAMLVSMPWPAMQYGRPLFPR